MGPSASLEVDLIIAYLELSELAQGPQPGPLEGQAELIAADC